MIKEISRADIALFSKNVGGGLSIEEKIDAPYFSIYITNDGASSIRKSNGDLVDFVDYTMNSLYKDVMDFSQKLAETIKGEEEQEYVVEVFYFPSETPRTIPYPEYAGKFMISKVSKLNETKTDFEQIDSIDFYNLLEDEKEKVVLKPIYKLELTEERLDFITKYTSGIYGEAMLMSKLLKEYVKPSKLMKAEAYLLRLGKKVFRVQINDKEILTDNIERKMSRDIVLKDFAEWAYGNKISIPDRLTYIGKVCDLFKEYINNTDVLNKYSLTEEDLTPPIIGYIGEMTYEFIPDKTVELILKNDQARRAIFKVILSTLRKPIKKKKDDILDDRTIKIINLLVEKVKEA